MAATNFDTFCVSPDCHADLSERFPISWMIQLLPVLVPQYLVSTPNPSVAKGVIHVETQQDLVARIQVAAGVICDIPTVRHDIITRYTKCIEVGGGHIQHLL